MQALKKGFTLTEIMFAVTVIGLLASLGTFATVKALDNARRRQAETELNVIATAALQLAWDTGKWPNGQWRNKPPSGDNEVWDLTGSGLVNGDPGIYIDWKGPYYEGPYEDPWGHKYFFDSDYKTGGVNRIAVGSFGPSGTGKTAYDENNIIVLVDDIGEG